PRAHSNSCSQYCHPVPGQACRLMRINDSRRVQAHMRGLVYGQETIKSARGFQAGRGVKVMEGETGQFSLSYDSSGAFELNETGTSPKFAIVAEVAAPNAYEIKGVDFDDPLDKLFREPSAERLASLRAAQIDH
ncbi:MAG: hypothetical protein KDD98_09160, partial [Sphingomonadaceae bacterium]|nr:hypothetical protein [Sphingomonadaceae bacterium]